MLSVQIPRLHIGVIEVMVYRLWRKARRTSDVDGVIKPDRAGESERDGQRRISTSRGYDTGHRLVDVDPIRSAQHGLAFPKGVQAKPTRG